MTKERLEEMSWKTIGDCDFCTAEDINVTLEAIKIHFEDGTNRIVSQSMCEKCVKRRENTDREKSTFKERDK